MSEPVALLAELVSVSSLSGEESAAADRVEAFASSQGFEPRRSGNNIWFELGTGGPRLLLHSHIDTVPAGSGWDADPWSLRRADGRLIGLGANDAKGCVAAILSAAARLQQSGLPRSGTVVVAVTAEEETGGPGGISSVNSEFGALDAAVFGEPTGLAPCTAQCGMLLLRCTAHGAAGHAAHGAALGLRNAIHVAARDIGRLEQLELEAYAGFDGSPVICRPQVTLISGGTSANQMPDACEFRVDLRTTPNLEHAQLLERLGAALESELSCLSQRYLPVSTAADQPVVQAALAASGRQAFFSRTVSDWSLVGGIPAVKIGPGETERSHQPNEYILESELAAGVALYEQLVQEYFERCGNG